MGFRDLESFNLVLLSKQLWRIHNRPSSLVATILKEKYFKNFDIFKTFTKWNFSELWHSLISAQQVLNEGARWKVGDGSTIHLWQDKWLPTLATYRVQSPPTILPSNAVVKDLILDVGQPIWNESLISSIFWKEEVDIIVKIPLSINRRPDKLIWDMTDNVDFP